ncbi:MAG: ABC transporter substrate-binding protein [Gemmatimonadaceae bacterium]|nr:ABC transporter substrate-binding protein [Gemmatimonadaceae bacterium]
MFSVSRRLVVWSAAACLVSASACSRTAESVREATSHDAPIVDDFGDTLRLARPATRIVSLNPVISEALYAVGAQARLVGRTRWDAAPPEIHTVPDVGDGLSPNVEAVLARRPDFVVLYAAEANRAAATAFRRAGVPTLALRTDRIADFARAMHALGVALGDSSAVHAVVDSVARSLRAVAALPARTPPVSVFWHAWDAPIITIGAGSYLDELVARVGARNVFADLRQPSPQVTLESIAERNPDFVLAGPRAAVRLRADPRWRAVAAVREGRVLVIDTALVGRPGVRMGEAARALRALLDSAVGARR